MKKLIFFLITLIFWSCSEKQTKKEEPNTNEAEVVKVDSNFVHPEIFQLAFINNYKNNGFTFKRKNIGKLRITSGRLTISDPVTIKQAEPFQQLFPLGSHDIELSLTSKGYVAFVRVLFSNSKTIGWHYALLKDQKPIALSDSAYYCFSVDAGIACLTDLSCKKEILAIKQDQWSNMFFDQLKHFNYTGYLNKDYFDKMAVFTTGYGDGCYSTFIGFDKDNKPTTLLIDFNLVNWYSEQTLLSSD